MTKQPTYSLTLRSQPGFTVPPEVRLRRALKYLLRVCGLRCVTLNEPTAPQQIGNDAATDWEDK